MTDRLNREMRRLAEREERRAKQKGQKRPAGKPRPQAEEEKKSLFARILQFLREVRAELRRVVWPTRQETIQTTLIVLFVVLLVGIFLWLVDMMLLSIVKTLTGQGG